MNVIAIYKHMRKNKYHIISALACVILAGCAADINARGNLPPEDKLAQLTPGLTRDQVLQLLGSPSTIATFTDHYWYYIGQKTEDYAFYKPKVVERQVIIVQFNEEGIVDEIRTLEKDDGQSIQMVDRTTPSVNRDLSLMQQIFGNLGKGGPALPGQRSGGGDSGP